MAAIGVAADLLKKKVMGVVPPSLGGGSKSVIANPVSASAGATKPGALGAIPSNYKAATKSAPYSPVSASVAAAGSNPSTTGGVAGPSIGIIPGVLAGPAGATSSFTNPGATQLSSGAWMPVANAAQPQGQAAPTTGYGAGGTYGQTPGLGQAYAANTALISTPEGKQGEIDRTLKTIAERKAQGLDTSLQDKYLTNQLGYVPPDTTVATASNVTPSGGVIPNDVYNVRSSSDLQQQSGDSLAIERAALKNTVDAQMAALRQNAAYSQGLTNDSRALSDFSRTQSTNPFANMGKRTFDEALIGRQRSIDDAQTQGALATQLNSLSTEMANFDKLAPERQRQIFNELLALERQFGLDQANVTGQYGGQRTLAGQQLDWNKIVDEANMTGSYGGQRTLAGQQLDYSQKADQRDYDYQVGRDKVGDERYKNEFDYQIGRDKVQDSQWDKTFKQAAKQYGEQFAYQKARDSIGDKQWQKQFDEDIRRYGLNYALDQAQVRISQQNANTSAKSANNAANNANFGQLMDIWSATGKAPAGLEGYGVQAGTSVASSPQFDLMEIWKASGVAPEGIPGVPAGTPYGGKPSETGGEFKLNDYTKHIDDNFYKETSLYVGGPTQKTFDSTGARKYIISLNLDDARTDELLRHYGLPTNQ